MGPITKARQTMEKIDNTVITVQTSARTLVGLAVMVSVVSLVAIVMASMALIRSNGN